MATEKQLANLKQFPKGTSGNLSGRTKRTPVTDAYLWMWDKIIPKKLCEKHGLPIGSTWGAALTLGQFKAAIAGNAACATEIANRIQGRPAQQIELGGPDGGPIEIDVNKITVEFVGGSSRSNT